MTVPMVNSVEDARAVVGACRYPPDGYRSMGPIRARVVNEGWRLPVCVVMVETVEAVKRADEVLGVPGIDAVFIGANDLAVSAGLDSGYEGRDPEHRRLILAVRDAARSHGVTAGIMCGSAAVAKQWHDEGFQMLALESDSRLLTGATERLVTEARAAIPSPSGRG